MTQTSSADSSTESTRFDDIPDCWKTPDDVPSLEEICQELHDDPIAADAFFFQETNDPENAEDGSYQPLVDYQAAAFKELDDNQFVWFQGARGSAKSSSTARWAVGRALRRPGTKIGIMAPSFRQSKQLFDYCVAYIEQNSGVDSHVYKIENEIKGDIKRGHEVVIHFKNGSLIEALPMGSDGQKLRGRRYNVIIIDEAYQLVKSMLESHILPMGNVRIGNEASKVIYLTTSWYTDCFAFSVLQGIAKQIAAGKRGYSIIDVGLDDVINSGFPFDLGFVDHQIETQAEPVTGEWSDELKMTYANEWIKSSANFYMAGAIADCQRDDLPVLDKRPAGNKTIAVMGVDPATSGSDACAFSILGLPGEDARDLWATYMRNKLTPEQIAGYIHKFVDRYDLSLILMDKTGGLGQDIANICTRTDQLIDGVWCKRTPIYLWDHPDARLGRSSLVMTKPGDARMQTGVVGPRIDSAITGEIDMKNWMHLRMKQVIETGRFTAPKRRLASSDYYESERGEIMDDIMVALAQFPRIDRVKDGEGNLKTDYRGNWYFTKPAKDDGAYSIVYANYAAQIWYNMNARTVNPDDKSVLWEQDPYADRLREETHAVVKPRLS